MSTLSFVQEPVNVLTKTPVITNWNPIIGYMLFKDANISSLFYYKLVLEIRLLSSSGTLLGIIRQRRNGFSDDLFNNKARAFFDLRDIVNTQLVDTEYNQNCTGVPFDPIHIVGSSTGLTGKIFSASGDAQQGKTQLATIFVKGYEQYSSSSDESPQDVTTDAVESTHFYMQGTLPLFTPRFDTGAGVNTDFIQGNAMTPFLLKNDTKKFLSDIPKQVYGKIDSATFTVSQYINFVQSTDYHTIAFLNGDSEFQSKMSLVSIKYFDNSAQIGTTQYLVNNATTGGFNPLVTTDSSVTPSIDKEDKQRILYCGIGPKNLQEQSATTGARPSNFAGYTYYVVQGVDATLSPVTDKYVFILQDQSCKGFATRRLAFRNSLGCYDYFNFTKKSTQTVNVKRDTYSSLIGTFNKSKYRYDDYQRGKTVRKTTATLKETLNTDWITEEEATLIEKLVMSTNVYVLENADTEFTQAVMVTSSSHIRKTNANDGVKIQYSIDIEYANELNTNS